MKFIKRLILVIVIVIVLAVLVVWLAINPIARTAVEGGASDTLGVKTTLAGIQVSPLRGRVLMNDLKIANPEGFISTSLVDAGRFEIEVAPMSLLSDTIEIRKFEIDGLEMNIEQKLPISNIAKIIDNIKRSGGDKPKDEGEGEGKKVTADLVLIKNVTAHFQLLPGASEVGKVTVTVPQIELKNVSSEKGSSVAGQLIAQLFPAVLASVVKEGQGLVPTEFLNDLNGQVADLAKSLGEGATQLAEVAGADYTPRRFFCALQGRQQQAGKDRNDGDDHQQFN